MVNKNKTKEQQNIENLTSQVLQNLEINEIPNSKLVFKEVGISLF